MNQYLTFFLKAIIIFGLFLIPVFIPIETRAQNNRSGSEEMLIMWDNLPPYIIEGISDPFTLDLSATNDFSNTINRDYENPYSTAPPTEQITQLKTDIDKIQSFMSNFSRWGDGTFFSRVLANDSLLTKYLRYRIDQLENFITYAEANEAQNQGDNVRADTLRTQAQNRDIELNNIRDQYGQQVQNRIDELPNPTVRQCVSLLDGFDIDICIANALDTFYGITLWLLSWLLWLVDTLFAKIIDITIISFGDRLEQLNVVDFAWKVVRDIANIFFIFILLYLAISTALQTPGVDTRKVLVNIIIIALVINFSAV